MNNCRVLLLLSVSFFLLLLSGLQLSAQVVPNKAGLQRASQAQALKEAAFQQILTRTAQQKGWPLTLRNKKGRLAYLRGINTSGLPIYVTTTDNTISAATIGTSKVWPGGGDGLSLNGGTAALKGKIAVWDEGGVRSTHIELNGRVVQKDNPGSLSDHSTHVTGTMIAAGVNPLAKGMSFGAQQLLAYDFTNDESEMMAASAGGLLVSNHSYADVAGWYFDDGQQRWEFWGNPGDTVDIKFGQYDQDARIWDTIAYAAPSYLIAKAAGNSRNDTGPAEGQTYYRMNAQGQWVAASRPAGISNNNGYMTIPTYGNAKNILVLGAVNPIPGGYKSSSDVVLANFSSVGPTGDGRIKPDLVADGVNVLSTVATADNAYDYMSGTSMATPAAAGSSFLLQDYYSQKHPGKFLLSSSVKGLMIHTANEAGAAKGPDYSFGWGLINMEKAAAVITADATGDKSQQIIEGNLANTTAYTTTITASGKTPVWATICWTDVPGTPATIPANSHNFKDVSPKLVNDLDLRITDNTTSKVYFPWVLDPNNPDAPATKGDNKLDNVEKVELSDSLIPGRQYTISVKAKSITGPGQAFSLLISGGGGQAACASASSGTGGANLTQVTVGGINNTSSGSCRTYTDYTSLQPATLPVGGTVPVTLVTGNCGGVATDDTRFVKIFIDYNNDGTFDPTTELAYQSQPWQATDGAISGNITVPVTAIANTYARMRVIVEQTTDPSTILPCGTYAIGETQDYRVVFGNPANDVGVSALEYPTQAICSSDSQLVSVRIHNYGSATQAGGIPVTTIITGGSSPITLTAVCKDSILSGGEVVFTYNKPIATVGGTTYTFISSTSLSGDPNTSNDKDTAVIAVSSDGAAGKGSATVCGTTSASVLLHAETSGIDVPLWYETATSTTPLAAGSNTTTTVVPADKTYYLGVNDLDVKGGAPNKTVFTPTGSNQGAYFRLGGNFMMISTYVPLTIESAKMYIGHSGKITVTLATLLDLTWNAATASNNYNYQPLYSTTIDVYATKLVPDTSFQINVPTTDNSDTGATFLLNIPVPNPGNYILITDCSPTTNAFINVNINKDPYPISIPGVFAVTGNDFRDGKTDSIAYSHKFYYPFYNMGIKLMGCPTPRTAVTAQTEASPAVTLNGKLLSSSATTNNQWYVNDSLLSGHTGQTDTASIPGVYYTVVSDPATGCQLTSNKVTYTPSGGDPNDAIGLKLWPVPAKYYANLLFYMSSPANTSVSLVNIMGQRVFEEDYPNFSGLYSKQIPTGNLASGVYTLQIIHGGQTWHKELSVVR